MNELIQRSKNKQTRANQPEKPLNVLSHKKLSKAEIADASDTVRSNLVEVLLKISDKLANLPADLVGTQNLAQVARLTDTAQKLFGWPSTKPIDASIQQNSPSAAINLALIRTTPEQLRNAAKKNRIESTVINLDEPIARAE